MNATSLHGACADHEADIVDLHDGTLPAERAAELSRHLETCARCRDWAAELAAMDADLGAALPRPSLSPDFGGRLAARIAAESQPARRTDLRAAADSEYERMLDALRRGTRGRAISGITASLGIALGIIAAVGGLLPAVVVQTLPQFVTVAPLAAYLALGGVVAVAALAWSATRGLLPGARPLA